MAGGRCRVLAEGDFRVRAKSGPHCLPVKVQRGKSGDEPGVQNSFMGAI